MKLKSLLLVFLLAAGVFSTSMFGYIFGKGKNNTPPSPQRTASAETDKIKDIPSVSRPYKEENVVTDFEESYVLREKDGKIALFIRYANGDEILHSDYDVSVSLLPKNDREELKEGIELSSLNEAMQLVEDYVG